MTTHAAITVHRSREEVERLWSDPFGDERARVWFADAPGDRGTEIHVELTPGGTLQKLAAGPRLAKVKDELRRFKQRVETGEVARSDATLEGESAMRKFRQRPAQPQREKAGVS
jgi:hypothetical protein